MLRPVFRLESVPVCESPAKTCIDIFPHNDEERMLKFTEKLWWLHSTVGRKITVKSMAALSLAFFMGEFKDTAANFSDMR